MIDQWIRRKIELDEGEPLTRDAIEKYQLVNLIFLLEYVKARSPFYAQRLAALNPANDIKRLGDLSRVPFTDGDDLICNGAEMVCVPASGVSRIVTLPTSENRIVTPPTGESRIVTPPTGESRIVTLPTSGTTGNPKRVYFTEEDLELFVDYTHHGQRVLTGPGDVYLILMPCERPGSVGDLVRLGLERMGVETIPFGILPFDGSRDEEVLALMRERGVNAMLSTTSAAVRLVAKYASDKAGIRTGGGAGCSHRAGDKANDRTNGSGLRSVLLSAEYVSDEAVALIESAWNCKVFEHYGMTEMGLGGAMACAARVGYHPRETDLLFEIIDPVSGKVLPDGEFGEVVFTTLTRAAMPLVRYRTGDISRWIPGPCPCGSILKRLDRIQDRKAVKGY
jgi:phenylacetate-coenzyme A ligase PaaK-like adenylate-forming protein